MFGTVVADCWNCRDRNFGTRLSETRKSRDLSGVETQLTWEEPTDLPIRLGPVFTMDRTFLEETRSASVRKAVLPALAGRVVSPSSWRLPS